MSLGVAVDEAKEAGLELVTRLCSVVNQLDAAVVLPAAREPYVSMAAPRSCAVVMSCRRTLSVFGPYVVQVPERLSATSTVT